MVILPGGLITWGFVSQSTWWTRLKLQQYFSACINILFPNISTVQTLVYWLFPHAAVYSLFHLLSKYGNGLARTDNYSRAGQVPLCWPIIAMLLMWLLYQFFQFPLHREWCAVLMLCSWNWRAKTFWRGHLLSTQWVCVGVLSHMYWRSWKGKIP